VFNILLQVLDDGRLTDNKGRLVNFKNSIIIMTSNVGSHIIQENFSSYNEENAEEVLFKTKNEVFDLLKKSMRPEFLNRIDELVMFKPLGRSEIRKIVGIHMNDLKNRLAESGMVLEYADDILDHLGDVGYDPQFGARPLKRTIQKKVLNQLSKEIISGNVKKDSVVGLTLENNEIKFINLDQMNVV